MSQVNDPGSQHQYLTIMTILKKLWSQTKHLLNSSITGENSNKAKIAYICGGAFLNLILKQWRLL